MALGMWDLQHTKPLNHFLGHVEKVNCMDIFGKERPLTGSDDKTARYWRTERDAHLVWEGHTSSVDACSSVQQDKFVTGSQDASIKLWSADANKPLCTVKHAHGGGDNWISALGCYRNSDFVLSGSNDG